MSNSFRYPSVWGNAPLSQKYEETSSSEYSPGLASTCSNSRCSGPMRAKPTRCTNRGRRMVSGVAATHATATTTMEAAKTPNPTQLPESRAA